MTPKLTEGLGDASYMQDRLATLCAAMPYRPTPPHNFCHRHGWNLINWGGESIALRSMNPPTSGVISQINTLGKQKIATSRGILNVYLQVAVPTTSVRSLALTTFLFPSTLNTARRMSPVFTGRLGALDSVWIGAATSI